MSSSSRSNVVRAVLAAVIGVGLLACGGDDPTSPSAPPHLVFATEPLRTEPGAQLTPAPRIELRTPAGGLSTRTLAVTLVLETNAQGAHLSGTTTLNATGGVATFTDVVVNGPPGEYRLVATANALQGVWSGLIAIGPTFAALSAGGRHSCGLTISGVVYCWGDNSSGQLGDGTTTQRIIPTLVAGDLRFSQISAGNEQTCGVTTTGTVYCWGSNLLGQLGDGTTSQRTVPTAVVGATQFVQVSTGYEYSCGVATGNQAYCWGRNDLGQLGDSSTTAHLTPNPVAGSLTVSQISANIHTCAVTTLNAAYCWGRNVEGQLGDGSPVYYRNWPTQVVGAISFRQVATGSYHTCSVNITDRAYCWGEDWATTAVEIPGAYLTVSSGARFGCGLATNHHAVCWGDNVNAQLGDGTVDDKSAPTAVAGGLSFTQLSSGTAHSCGLATDRRAYCWGYNFLGGLGDGTTEQRLSPVQVVQ